MEIGNIIPHIEALIFASDKPLTSMELTELINNAFGFMEEKLTMEQIQTALDGIIEKYASEFYPFEVRESGGGWQFLTKKDFHKTVAQLNGEKFLKRLSSAALETLAIIAYKQPITKGEIESIRGVSSDYSIQKLLEKELIIISGRNEEMPGKPLVYATSKTFMDYFGINSAADLPKLKEVFAETLIEPTLINHQPGEVLPEADIALAEGVAEESAETVLIVSENGELLEHEDSQASEETTAEETTGSEEDVKYEATEGGDEEIADSEERSAAEEASGEEEDTEGEGDEDTSEGDEAQEDAVSEDETGEDAAEDGGEEDEEGEDEADDAAKEKGEDDK